MDDISLKRMWDKKAVLDYAKEEGVQQERAKTEKLLAEERAKTERLLAKAEAEKLADKRKMAFEFKKLGVPIADIAKASGLSIEEIENLK